MKMTPRDRDRSGHGQALGRYVRERRLALGLLQEDVADRMGIDYEANWVTQLEIGRRVALPPQPGLGRLAEALQVSEVDLLRAAGVIPEGSEESVKPPEDPNVSILVSRIRGMSPAQLAAMVVLSDAVLSPGFQKALIQGYDARTRQEGEPSIQIRRRRPEATIEPGHR